MCTVCRTNTKTLNHGRSLRGLFRFYLPELRNRVVAVAYPLDGEPEIVIEDDVPVLKVAGPELKAAGPTVKATGPH